MLLLCICSFSLWQARRIFQRVFLKPLQHMGTKKKRCLSAQEMNQFASMNHHSASQNSSSICSGSWPFVARFSLAAWSSHTLLNSEGARILRIHKSYKILTWSNKESLSVGQNHLKSNINKSLLLSYLIQINVDFVSVCVISHVMFMGLMLLEKSSQTIIQLQIMIWWWQIDE